MRRSSALITTLALAAGSLLWSSAPAQAAAPSGQATVEAGSTAARPKAYVRVLYPTRMRRGGSATFSYKATRLRRIEADGVVLAAFLPKNTVSKVRFLSKPPHSKCGYYASRAYCVVKLKGANTISMRLQISVKYKYAGKYYINHYARAIGFESGLSTRDYVRQISREDLIAKSKTIISLR
jgi:hypothetical protein